jgi:hypothetical protein
MVRPAVPHHATSGYYEQLAATILIAETFNCWVGFAVLLDDELLDDDGADEDDELIDETVPVTSTRWPTCLVSSSLRPSSA